MRAPFPGTISIPESKQIGQAWPVSFSFEEGTAMRADFARSDGMKVREVDWIITLAIDESSLRIFERKVKGPTSRPSY